MSLSIADCGFDPAFIGILRLLVTVAANARCEFDIVDVSNVDNIDRVAVDEPDEEEEEVGVVVTVLDVTAVVAVRGADVAVVAVVVVVTAAVTHLPSACFRAVNDDDTVVVVVIVARDCIVAFVFALLLIVDVDAPVVVFMDGIAA